MKKSHDTISIRLASILTKLNDGESFTAQELSEEFNVNLRTIQRDLNERLSCLPLKKENGFYSLESYVLGKLSFKDIKNFAAISGTKSLYPSLTNEFITDILNSKINQVYLINGKGFENLESKTKEFELLSVAILKYQKLTFLYSEKIREVNPYKLVNNNDIWYLLGDEEGKLKTYSFSKIVSLNIKDTLFKPNTKLLSAIANNDSKWFSSESVEVTLEIDKSLSEYFLRRDILPNKTILEQRQDKLIISTRVSYEEEILGIVKHGLPHIKILSPKSLQKKLENQLTTYLKS